ncbi:hypothetical protein X560_2170 [Listeria fleischmannii 1991]|uniref:Uncharacterized protein n=1 Tax=Listeria fleischmannii 1991 TaxID=1430899 RepID=A0A0J8GBT4_9LIST|nr:hypothetical protein X560_2170 [Listeria fleischmannii 1991]
MYKKYKKYRIFRHILAINDAFITFFFLLVIKCSQLSSENIATNIFLNFNLVY